MLIDLSAYSPSHRQSCRAMVVQALEAGMDLEALRLALELPPPIEEPVEKPVEMSRPGRLTMRTTQCPQCGGMMIPVINSEELPIMGCKQCRYSRIERKS